MTNTYTVGGSLSGLTAGGLVLLDNGGDALTVGANATQFTMPTAVAHGNPYAVSVQSAPAGLVCAVAHGSGTMGPGDVTGINVACTPNFALLHSFAGGTTDGANPSANLIQGSAGALYGSTYAGGAAAHGTFFKVSLQ